MSKARDLSKLPIGLITNDNGFTGIGTANPQVSLDAQKSGDVQIRARETGLGVDTRMLAVGGTSQAGVLGTYSNHPLVINTNGVEAFRIPSNAGGIQFLATQRASSDANTLDDYEEGTWTPVVNLLGTVTHSYQLGWYVKVGKFVTIGFYITVSSNDTTQDANVMQITNLPFTVVNATRGVVTTCILSEQLRGINNNTAPNTFHVMTSVNANALNVMQNNYNGNLAGKSYYTSLSRAGYNGGNLYMHGALTYESTS